MGFLRGARDAGRSACGPSSTMLPFVREGRAALLRFGGRGSGRPRLPRSARRLDAAGFRANPERAGARKVSTRRPHRHHLARRDRLHQPRPVREPPRAVRPRGARRRLQARAHPLNLHLGYLAEGPALRARHRRKQSLPHARGARAVAFAVRRAALSGRHALRSVHRPRPRCAELRLLPGRPLHPGGDARRA